LDFVHVGYKQLISVHDITDRQLPTVIDCYCAAW